MQWEHNGAEREEEGQKPGAEERGPGLGGGWRQAPHHHVVVPGSMEHFTCIHLLSPHKGPNEWCCSS